MRLSSTVCYQSCVKSGHQCHAMKGNVLQCSVLQCSVLQCIVLQCSVLQCSVLQCSVLQCSVLQCSVVWCNTLVFSAVQGGQWRGHWWLGVAVWLTGGNCSIHCRHLATGRRQGGRKGCGGEGWYNPGNPGYSNRHSLISPAATLYPPLLHPQLFVSILSVDGYTRHGRVITSCLFTRKESIAGSQQGF